jgi:hypothetical protein
VLAVGEEGTGAAGGATNGATPASQPVLRRYVLAPQDPVRAGELGRACSVSPALGQVLLNRGIVTSEHAQRYLSPKLAELSRPDQMADRARAAI